MVLLLQKAILSDIYTTFPNTYTGTMSLMNGTYYITNDTLGKAVDLSDSNIPPNTPIIGFTPNESKDNQKVIIFSSAKSFRCPIVLMTFL